MGGVMGKAMAGKNGRGPTTMATLFFCGRGWPGEVGGRRALDINEDDVTLTPPAEWNTGLHALHVGEVGC